MTGPVIRLVLDQVGAWSDALLCRMFGIHGRGCRGRPDHMAGWRIEGGRYVWHGRGWWRRYPGPLRMLIARARYSIRIRRT